MSAMTVNELLAYMAKTDPFNRSSIRINGKPLTNAKVDGHRLVLLSDEELVIWISSTLLTTFLTNLVKSEPIAGKMLVLLEDKPLYHTEVRDGYIHLHGAPMTLGDYKSILRSDYELLDLEEALSYGEQAIMKAYPESDERQRYLTVLGSLLLDANDQRNPDADGEVDVIVKEHW